MQVFLPSRTAFWSVVGAFLALLALAAPALAQQCPDWRQSAARSFSYSSDHLWSPRSHSVIAGGGINLRNCTSVPGVGYVTLRPDFAIQFTANQRRRDLEFRVRGSCDTVLLVNDAQGRWHFNDDADGTLHPRLRLPAAREGRYDVWVGTYGPSTCQATLTVETFGGTVAPPPPPLPPRPLPPRPPRPLPDPGAQPPYWGP